MFPEDRTNLFEQKAKYYMDFLSDPGSIYIYIGNQPINHYDFLGLFDPVAVMACMDRCQQVVDEGLVVGCVNEWTKKCERQCFEHPNWPPPLPFAVPARRPGGVNAGVNHGFVFILMSIVFIVQLSFRYNKQTFKTQYCPKNTKLKTYKVFQMFLLMLIMFSLTSCSKYKSDLMSEEDIIIVLTSTNTILKKKVLKQIVETAEKQKEVSGKVTDALLLQLDRETSYQIKIRIIMALTRAEKDKVVPRLIKCLSITDPDESGSGLVPTTAAAVLSEIGDARAIEPVQTWVTYLKNNRYTNDDDNSYQSMLRVNTEYLKRLEELNIK